MLARAVSRRTLLSGLAAFVAPAVSSGSGASTQHDGGATDPTAEDVSLALVRAICLHCAAYSELLQIAQHTDAVVVGRPGTRDEFDRLDAASDLEERLLLALCEHRAANDAERHDKATYLLGIFDGEEPEPQLITAILRSMTQESARVTEP
ncbi:hypothetical protein NKJ71_09555 [Mesorhizobium sp. M0050]|uniref:hypothetical protein n=1 Tax=Mesorhizobium sp. M0050 TaxID=2956861 RepID=UPI003335A25D